MRIVEMGGVYNNYGTKRFGRKIFTTIDKAYEVAKKFNNIDVYSTVFTYDSEEQDKSDLYGPFYLDLDMEINTEIEYGRLKRDLLLIVQAMEDDYKIPRDRMLFYFTGKKGFHILVPQSVFGLSLIKDTNVYYKLIAQDLQRASIHKVIDTVIYDNKRLFRLPNTINSKSGLYKVPITLNDIKKFSFEEIKAYASAPKKLDIKIDTTEIKEATVIFHALIKTYKVNYENKRKKRLDTNVDIGTIKLAKCINKIILEGANDGARNNTAVVLASALMQRGVNQDQVSDMLFQWNEAMVSPPIENGELIKSLESARKMTEAGRHYGCSAIKNLGYCSNECKYNK